METMPLPFRELAIAGVYISSMYVLLAGSVIIVWGGVQILNYYRLGRYLWHPPLAFVCLIIICFYLLTWILLL